MNKSSQAAALKMNSFQKQAFRNHPYRNGTAAQQKAAVDFAMTAKPLSAVEIQTLKQMGLL
jgi:hypothetical protein